MRHLMFYALVFLASSAVISAATRQRLTGEIEVESAQQSGTARNDEATYGAANAIDLNFNTEASCIADKNGKSYMKFSLGQIYCVEQAVEIESDGTTRQQTWTCTNSDCSNCVGKYCSSQRITVTSEKAAANNLPPESNCKYGDTVTLDNIDGYALTVYEIAIIGKQVLCEAPTIDGGKVSPSTDISLGSSYTVTCNGGFTLKGNSEISCTENNGKATLSTSPTCEKDAKDDDKTKLSFANCLNANAALLVVLTAVLLI